MKHVCVVTSAHPWDDTRVASRITTTLLEAGYRVTWVGPDRTLSATRDVKLAGVEYRLFDTGGSRRDRLAGAARAERIARTVKNVDWWYAPDPDMASRLPRLSRRFGGRTIFDIHENYHGGLLDRWFPMKPPKFIRDIVRRRIEGVCDEIDLTIGVSRTVLKPYCKNRERTVVIRNLAPAWFAGDPPQTDISEHLRVMHGKVAGGNGTLEVAAAVGQLPREVRQALTVVMLNVTATPVAAVGHVERVASEGGGIEVLPGVPHDEMAALMSSCAVGLISYQRNLGHESLPQRLFEYMAAGLAILAPSYSPEIVAIIDEEKIGLACDFEDPSEIASALAWCAANPEEVRAMGLRARDAYLARYTWNTEGERLIRALADLEN